MWCQAALAGLIATSSPVPVAVPSFAAVRRSPLPPAPAGRLCVLEAARGLFPSLDARQLLGFEGYGPALEWLRDGLCGSAVIGPDEYLLYVQVSLTMIYM